MANGWFGHMAIAIAIIPDDTAVRARECFDAPFRDFENHVRRTIVIDVRNDRRVIEAFLGRCLNSPKVLAVRADGSKLSGSIGDRHVQFSVAIEVANGWFGFGSCVDRRISSDIRPPWEVKAFWGESINEIA